MKKNILILLGFIFFIGISFSLEKATSGIGKVEYHVEWCNSIFGCKEGYFKSLSATVGPESTDGFTTSSNFRTICTNCTTDTGIKDLFNNINLKGEGVYTIMIRTYDNVKYGAVRKCDGTYTSSYTDGNAPGNCSELKFIYKIDKTHPNIFNPNKTDSSYSLVEEESKKVYIGRSDKQINVKDFDANNNNENSGTEKVSKGDYSGIEDTPLLKNALRKKLKTIYYSDDNQQITLKLNLKNYFENENHYYDNGGTISKLTKVELLNQDHSLRATWTLSNPISLNWSKTGKIKDFFGNNVNQKVFFLRVYDEAGNYSETPIYLVKDDKAPITLNEFLNTFTFDDGEKTFYTTGKIGPRIEHKNSIPSKFFVANNNLTLSFNLSDKKNGNTNKENSGLLKFKIIIEKKDDCNLNNGNNYTFTPSDSFNQENGTTIEQTWSLTHDFSSVDRCLQDSNKTYRYYKAKIVSVDDDGNEYENEICDKVGNCTEIAPLVFRVVADKLDETKSKIQVLSGNLVSGKMIANGKSYYALQFTLKDKYGNKIVPVYSQEDNKQIKTSKLTFSFYNRLYLNQIDKNDGSGVFRKSLESDEKTSAIESLLETGDKDFLIEEDPKANPNGVYSFKIYSVVPTKSLYPWINSGAYLQLNKVNFLSKDITNGDITKYNNIGQFNIDKFNGSDINELKLNTGNLAYNDTVNKYLTGNIEDYGKVKSNDLFNENTINGKGGNKIRFNFASPVLIGLYNIKNLSEGVKNIYNYNLWNIDDSVISKNNFSIQEKWITNGIYDFTQGSGSTSFAGQKIELIGKNFDNNVRNLSILGSFNSNKQISKYTKISINPDLALFVDPNDTHIALGTKINYQINGNKVMLPADGKGVSNSKVEDVDDKTFGDSLAILNGGVGANSDDYDDELRPIIKEIKILGVNNTAGYEKKVTTSHKNVSIGGDVRKWQVRNKISKKIAEIMRGNKWGNTCNAGSCNGFKYRNENIYPVNGDLTFTRDYEIDGKITYIVKGNVYIKGNLYKKDKNSLLSIIAINPDSFSRKGLEFKNNFNDFKSNKGFVFINPKVTNIDAFIYAQGSLLSYNDSKIFDGSNTFDTDTDMFNQLYIRGGIISSNTIGASRLLDGTDKKCPWFVKTCNTNIAQAFDLVYLRRYMLTDANIYGGPSGKQVPYIPVSIANTISTYNSKKPFMGGKRYCKIINGSSVDCNKDGDSNLQNIPDKGMEYPLYIEFDPAIKTNTPFVFTP